MRFACYKKDVKEERFSSTAPFSSDAIWHIEKMVRDMNILDNVAASGGQLRAKESITHQNFRSKCILLKVMRIRGFFIRAYEINRGSGVELRWNQNPHSKRF